MSEIDVRFFGQCKQLTGVESLRLRLPEPSSVQAVLALLYERYPSLTKLADRLLVAVNEQYAPLDASVVDGDTVAVFPPVSGGQSDDLFALTREPIDTPGLVRRLLRHQDGAVVTFEGVVRDHSMGKAVLYLEYEGYEPMAMKMLHQIGQEIHERWPIDRVGIIHRLGRLQIGETSVAIVVTSAHRKQAFEACQYAIDRLKKIVPIWKREYFHDGAVWVDGESCAHQ
ncbi:MAG: molybdenum cofactor biosynthesis protein MoaE [Acidobacteriota bacterium]|nr:molybdenum cofactor biosynthesis protein MoaE [Blastocatellia bacterium]MDW8238246.1 molybdenum cofactor biosynthesis protein MoaE [Acidobacteriota bacterium]